MHTTNVREHTCSNLLIWSDAKSIVLTQPQVERVYSSSLELNLEDVEPCISGPKRYNFQYKL